MFNIKTIILYMFFIGVTTLATAQESHSYSLEEYRNRVLEYSYTLKSSSEKTAGAYAATRRNYTDFLPKLYLDGDFSFSFPKHYIDNGDGNILLRPYAFALQPAIVQNIYLGGAVRNQYEQSKINHEISEYNEESTKLDVAYLAEYNYWNLASNKELLDVTIHYENIVKEMYNIINARFEDGFISKTDLLMITNRLRSAEYSRISIENLYQVSLQNFNILMGMPPDSPSEVKESILEMIEQPAYQNPQEAIQQHPSYKAAELRVDMNKYGVKLAASKFNPQLTGGVQGIWNTNTPNINGATSLNGVAFVKLSVPIFHWGERKHSVAIEQANVRSAENDRGQVADQMTQDILKAWTDIVQTTMQIEIAKENLIVAKENLDLNTFSYNEGRLTILDVISAQISWIQAYTNVITSNFNQKIAISAYKKATCEP